MEQQQHNGRKSTVEVARNMLGSRVAKALLEDKRFPDRALQLRLRRIESECKQQTSRHDSHQRLFRNNMFVYNFEPTMVVERNSSPSHFTETVRMFDAGKNVPHYMTGLDKHRPSMYIPMTKLDAFKVVRKRQKNLWEREVKGVPKPTGQEQFRSILKKSPRLSFAETNDLNIGWTAYRPVSRIERSIQERLNEKRTQKKTLANTVKRQQTPTAYITQLDTEENVSTPDVTATTTKGSKSLPAKLRHQLKDHDTDKIQGFERVRARQKHEYFRYIRRGESGSPHNSAVWTTSQR